MKIERATVVIRNNQPDAVVLYTELQDPCDSDQKLSLDMKAPMNSGVEWVRKNFNIQPAIVDARSKRTLFSR